MSISVFTQINITYYCAINVHLNLVHMHKPALQFISLCAYEKKINKKSNERTDNSNEKDQMPAKKTN